MSSRPVNFRHLDLNLLRVFDVVMEERNVTRAAQRLAITQPAVSNALRRLRESANEELFIPSSSGMQPTPHALALWPVVREALMRLQQAFEPQPFDPAEPGHGFTLSMADATAALLVPTLAQRFQREGVKVGLRVVPLTTRDPRALLEQGGADLAIGFFPDLGSLPLGDDEAGSPVHRAPLYNSEYVCVMRRGHALAGPEPLGLDAYCAAEHLRVSFAGRARGFVDDALATLGRERRVALIVGNFFTGALAVRQSDLLTVLPSGFVAATGLAEDLAIRPLPFALPSIAISQLWHARHEHDPAQRWLREEVRRAVGEKSASP
ncbi:LysR family transcriptional regulator [Roseateles violae]|uniref:LysR family transcriptional regulator n=1 Tax=Roseateles violae TaxID=3058042 RepID=A0ABT8DSY6_9BURK|nr:LysR family transcriptional regulator [Pelomonas sp. PFR6]MDN3920158.1 LysR family transcriptional regulator [Pelomonas sp. PFR6]